MVVYSSGNKVGVMFGSAERVLYSLGMPEMLNGNESSALRLGQNCFLGCTRALCLFHLPGNTNFHFLHFVLSHNVCALCILSNPAANYKILTSVFC